MDSPIVFMSTKVASLLGTIEQENEFSFFFQGPAKIFSRRGTLAHSVVAVTFLFFGSDGCAGLRRMRG